VWCWAAWVAIGTTPGQGRDCEKTYSLVGYSAKGLYGRPRGKKQDTNYKGKGVGVTKRDLRCVRTNGFLFQSLLGVY